MWAILGCLGWAALAVTSIYILDRFGTPAWVYGLVLITLPATLTLANWYRD